MWKVYKITNKTYNQKEQCYKSYIGITQGSVENRFKEHCRKDGCKVFFSAIQKYGENNWNFEILKNEIKTEKEALEKETFYIRKYNTLVKNKKGYNIKLSADPRKIINGKLECLGECCLWKPIKNFSKNKNSVCGYGTWCKDCKRKYNQLNKEHNSKRNKKYAQENKEKIKNNSKKYGLKNKNKLSEKSKIRNKKISKQNSTLTLNDLYLKTLTKKCYECKIIKSTKKFGRCNGSKDGFKNICKLCKNSNANIKNKEKSEINKKIKLSLKIMCPLCNNKNTGKNCKNKQGIQKYFCEDCRKSFILEKDMGH